LIPTPGAWLGSWMAGVVPLRLVSGGCPSSWRVMRLPFRPGCGPFAARPLPLLRWPVSTPRRGLLQSGGGRPVPMLWWRCTSGRKACGRRRLRASCSSVEASSSLCAVVHLPTWLGQCLPLVAPLAARSYTCGTRLLSWWLDRGAWTSWGCLSMRHPSTIGSAHRCRRPSLGYSTPFDRVWSRWHIAFSNAGGTPVSPHGLGYPTPFDCAGMLLRVLLLVSTYSTTCSPGLPACGVYFSGDTRSAVGLRSPR
jgi:hypothetical protein